MKTVYCAPGNVGMQTIGVETVPIEETDLDGLLEFAKNKKVDWTFVGPENVFVLALLINLKRQDKRFSALTKEWHN